MTSDALPPPVARPRSYHRTIAAHQGERCYLIFKVHRSCLCLYYTLCTMTKAPLESRLFCLLFTKTPRRLCFILLKFLYIMHKKSPNFSPYLIQVAERKNFDFVGQNYWQDFSSKNWKLKTFSNPIKIGQKRHFCTHGRKRLLAIYTRQAAIHCAPSICAFMQNGKKIIEIAQYDIENHIIWLEQTFDSKGQQSPRLIGYTCKPLAYDTSRLL